jgi:mRNA-degrading endonuclease RelE of RelBE toxin-antitoxin system
MSTSELVKQLKALPPRERRKVVKAILALEENEPTGQPMKTKRVKWPDVEARARRIFGNRVLPNLVLLDREEEAL